MKKALILVLLLLAASFIPLFADPLPTLDRSEVNSFDRLTMQRYREGLDIAGDIVSIISIASPAVLYGLPSEQRHIVSIMYAETTALSLATATILKDSIKRERPYMYFEGYPQHEVASGDSNRSFPSRHSIMAFASATFTSFVFSKYYPDSEWKIPVIAISYGLAATTSALRVASGNHFATDVIVSALIGTAIGIAVPALHTTFDDNRGTDFQNPPFGLMFSIVL